MTVYFPDSPGDCPIGMYCSVIFCAEGADALPHRSALIPTSATTNFRTVISPPLRPSLDEERSCFLLLSDGLLRVPPTEEWAPDGLVRQASCFVEVSDSFGVKAAAPEHASAVVRLASGASEKACSLRGGRHREARLQQHDALPDVLEHVDDSQEGGDRHDLRPIELDALTLGVELGQRAARRGFVERLAVVERDRSFDGLDGVVVEERSAVRRLHERRNVERAVPRRAKS